MNFIKISIFLKFFWAFLVTSLVNSQEEWNSRNLKIEIMKMNDKFSYCVNEIDKLIEKEKNSSVVLEQLSTELKQSRHENHRIKQEMLKLTERNVVLENSVFVTKPHVYFGLSHEYFKKAADFVWTIYDMKKNMKQIKFELLSPVFPLRGYSFGAQIKLTVEKDHVYCRLAFKHFEDVKKSDKTINIVPTVYYTVKSHNQSEGDLIREINHLFLSKFHFDTFGHHRDLFPTSHPVRDTMTLQVHVEPYWVLEQGHSYDGRLSWAIEDFREKVRMGREDLLRYQLSPYFFTSPKGYRVRANTWANGFGKFTGQGLTVRFYFLTGPYDARLATSGEFKVTVTLLHPSDPSRHVIKSTQQDLSHGREWRLDVATHQEVENLLNNGTLYYQVNVLPV